MTEESNTPPVDAAVVGGNAAAPNDGHDVDDASLSTTARTQNEPFSGGETANPGESDPRDGVVDRPVDGETMPAAAAAATVTQTNQPPSQRSRATILMNRIPLQFDGNQVHIRLGNGNVVGVPLQRQPNAQTADGIATSFGRHGNINIHISQVDPLLPQPIEYAGFSTPNAVDNREQHEQHRRPQEEDPALSRFKCDICYDFLRVLPVGCGKCSARFCQECLQRVYSDEARRRQPHKCPMCRVEYQDIEPDEALQRDMDAGPTVPCRYDGCPEQCLLLSMIASHEQTCEHVPVRCRYAMYGCSWTGKRGMIDDHEENVCKLSPIGPFVEQFRQLKAEMGGRVEVASQQAVGAARLQGSIRQSLARDQLKSTADFLQLLHYCHSLTCSTPMALLQKDKWLSYWRNDETRASVVNFLMFLPFLIPSITVGSQGLSSFCLCLEKLIFSGTKLLSQNSTLTLESAFSHLLTPQVERLLEMALIGFCTFMFGALAVALNFLDEKSNISWRGIKVGQLGTPPIIGDVLGICMFALFMCVIEYHDSGVRSVVLWILVLFSSTVLPSLILTLSHFMAMKDPPSASDVPSFARSIEPLMFGLRYSFLEAHFGMVACLDAAIIVKLVTRSDQNKFLKDCFVGQLPEMACAAFLGFKLALWGTEACNQLSQNAPIDDLLSSIADSLFASFVLCLSNELVHGLFTFGIKVGCIVATQSRLHVRPEGVAKDYSIPGIIAFGTWCVAIFAITQI